MIEYTLIVVTHGAAPHLDEAVCSLYEHVRPWPKNRVAFVDGHGRPPSIDAHGAWLVEAGGPQLGFCGNTARGWDHAFVTDNPYVLWLENDFRFEFDIDLDAVAETLELRRHLAQISFRRQPFSHEKIGLFGSPDFTEHHTERCSWMEQDAYFTTNPSLMRAEFMRSNPWVAASSECEGHMTIALRQRGYRFGVWGTINDKPWVTHLGARDNEGWGY